MRCYEGTIAASTIYNVVSVFTVDCSTCPKSGCATETSMNFLFIFTS